MRGWRMVAVQQAGDESDSALLRTMIDAAAGDHVGSGTSSERIRDVRQMVGVPDVVMTEISDIPSSRPRDSEVVRRALTAAVRGKLVCRYLRRSDRSHDVHRVVIAAVADDDQLKITKSLLQHGVQRGSDMRSSVIGGDDDRKRRCGFSGCSRTYVRHENGGRYQRCGIVRRAASESHERSNASGAS